MTTHARNPTNFKTYSRIISGLQNVIEIILAHTLYVHTQYLIASWSSKPKAWINIVFNLSKTINKSDHTSCIYSNYEFCWSFNYLHMYSSLLSIIWKYLCWWKETTNIIEMREKYDPFVKAISPLSSASTYAYLNFVRLSNDWLSMETLNLCTCWPPQMTKYLANEKRFTVLLHQLQNCISESFFIFVFHIKQKEIQWS